MKFQEQVRVEVQEHLLKDHLKKFQTVTIRGAQPSRRLSKEICSSERFSDTSAGAFRLRGTIPAGGGAGHNMRHHLVTRGNARDRIS